MTIAVLGAAGWLGRAVLQNLAGRHVVRAIDRGPEAWQTWEDIDGSWDGGEVVDADITDFEAVDAALDGIDAVIHSTVYFPDNDAPVKHAKTAVRRQCSRTVERARILATAAAAPRRPRRFLPQLPP